MRKEKYKDNLSLPFEKAETEKQRKLHEQIRQLFKQDFVINMSYPEVFDVMDRVKLTFQLDMCRRKGLIKFTTEIKEIVQNYENPYPKDIFVWDNKEKLNFNRGRFHRHCFEIVENMRQNILKELEE